MRWLKELRIRSGFTLLEMMIVVVIIGILAGTAIPMYGKYVAKSHRSEVFVMARHIIDATVVALEENIGQYSTSFPGGSASYGWHKVNAGEKAYWQDLGIEFDGRQRYSYYVQYWRIQYGDEGVITSVMITARAEKKFDIDGDPTPDEWLIVSKSGSFKASVVIDDLAD